MCFIIHTHVYTQADTEAASNTTAAAAASRSLFFVRTYFVCVCVESCSEYKWCIYISLVARSEPLFPCGAKLKAWGGSDIYFVKCSFQCYIQRELTRAGGSAGRGGGIPSHHHFTGRRALQPVAHVMMYRSPAAVALCCRI